jgi:hypothetical protein
MLIHSVEPQGNETHVYRKIYVFACVRPYGQIPTVAPIVSTPAFNCLCNTLAKHAVTLAIMEGSYNRPTQLLPKEDVPVVIWGNKITNDISHTIRFQASKEAARKYLGIKKKNPWQNKWFGKVDWEHLDLALRNKPDMYKIWRSKQNSGFYGTRV